MRYTKGIVSFPWKLLPFWNPKSQKMYAWWVSQLGFHLLSQQPSIRFSNLFFFLLKTEIHMYILNTEPFLCDLRWLRYLQNKLRFWNRLAILGSRQKNGWPYRRGVKNNFLCKILFSISQIHPLVHD